MTEKLWTAVDTFITDKLHQPDPVLEVALADSTSGGLPPIAVSVAQGKMLTLLAQAMGAKNILEVGTLGGYSTICLARALPTGGRLVTLEYDPKHAAVAKANIARAGFADIVDLRVGRAQETLPVLASEGKGPFDFIFIDADKPGYTEYLGWAVKLSRPGTVIIADNVVRDGEITNAASTDSMVVGIRHFYDALAKESRVTATTIQTVGAKGYDGFTIGLVKS
jgi:predicted O-methyltransferase YrrM